MHPKHSRTARWAHRRARLGRLTTLRRTALRRTLSSIRTALAHALAISDAALTAALTAMLAAAATATAWLLRLLGSRPALAALDTAARVRVAITTRTEGRGAVLGLAAAGLVAVALVGSSSALISTAAPRTRATAAAAAAAADRELAAQRADRSARTGAAVEAPATATPPLTAPATTTPPAPKPAWVSPMAGVPLSSCYGPRWGTMHQGIDFAGQDGTPILAVGAGTVFAAGWVYSGYGQSVVIDHGNGYLSHYAHASKLLVTAGQRVTAGQPIALEGSTGDSTGPHLHFEIHHGLWSQIDPAPWLRAHGVAVGC